MLDGTAQAQSIPARGKSHSGVIGTLSSAALSAPTLDLTLADGQVVTARLQRVARDDQKGVQSWVGTFDDAPGSLLVLSKAKGVVTGYANYKDQTLEVVAGRGRQARAVCGRYRAPPKTDLVNNDLGEAADVMAPTADYGTGGARRWPAQVPVPWCHDVLVLYTAASASKWGQATIESMIQSAVQSANQAYLNSHANVTLNVVGLQQSSVSESSGMGGTVDALKNNSTVRALRDRLAADMVIMVSENTGSCGYATLWYSYNGVEHQLDAYAVVNSDCLSNHARARSRAPAAARPQPRERHRHALRLLVWLSPVLERRVRDIMSYPCSTGDAAHPEFFSNPNVTYNGYPTGISYEANPAHSAENARTLNNTAAQVAAYRRRHRVRSRPTPPAAPSSLAVQGAAYNNVSIGWNDNSTNESGFQVQRSSDGVNFA